MKMKIRKENNRRLSPLFTILTNISVREGRWSGKLIGHLFRFLDMNVTLRC